MFPPSIAQLFTKTCGSLRLISKKGEGTFSEVLKARDLALKFCLGHPLSCFTRLTQNSAELTSRSAWEHPKPSLCKA